MATEWHYSKSGERFGPFSASDLKALAQSGELLPSDLIWKDGMSEWTPAVRLKGLFSDLPSDKNRVLPAPVPQATSHAPTQGAATSKSLRETAKAAAQFIAKQAERTKLTSLTLPSLYQSIGRQCFSSQAFRAEFSEVFQKLDHVESEIAGRAHPVAKTFKEKAVAIAR